MRASSAILLAGLAIAALANAPLSYAQTRQAQSGFRFSTPSPDAQAEASAQARKDNRIDAQLSTPCPDHLKNRKIIVLVGEEQNGTVSAHQGSFGPHASVIDARLQSLGLKTIAAAQIREQIAQQDIDAVFKNDPDHALVAARRVGAQYVLKGVIATQIIRSEMVRVNQVRVTMNFTLSDAAGRLVSSAAASSASYAGRDVSGMALTLVEERADEVVARLYSDYCQKAT